MFQVKNKKFLLVFVVTIIVSLILITFQEKNTNSLVLILTDSNGINPCSETELPTPDLIECAYSEQLIDKEHKILYLIYAFTDYDKLPARFKSEAPWRGTSYIIKINDVITSKEEFCQFSPAIQNEIRSYYEQAIGC